MALREVLGKHDVLVYLVGPGKKSVHLFESDGGDLLSLLKNAVVLEQNAPLGQTQLYGDHSRHRQPSAQGQEATSAPMPSSTTQQTEQVDFDVNKVSGGQITMAIMLSRITPLAK